VSRLKPRILVDVSKQDLSTTVLGHKLTMPIMVAPTAMQKMAHPEGKRNVDEQTARLLLCDKKRVSPGRVPFQILHKDDGHRCGFTIFVGSREVGGSGLCSKLSLPHPFVGVFL
jgi:hypothetical protein